MVLASRVFSTASSRSKQSLDNKSHLQNNQKHASAFAPGVLLFFLLTSSLRTPKIFVKEFSYFLMPCHQHGLGVNLLVQR